MSQKEVALFWFCSQPRSETRKLLVTKFVTEPYKPLGTRRQSSFWGSTPQQDSQVLMASYS